MGTEHSAAYLGIRERVTALVAPLGDLRDRGCPATPEWSVHDVLAHLVGVCDDVRAGRMEGVATDAWTEAQVAARRERPTPALLEEWDRLGPEFEAGLGVVPDVMAGQAIFDAVTHEHDLRHALGSPGARDSDGVAIAWGWLTMVGAPRAGEALVYWTTEGDTVTIGTGEVVADVRLDRFEFVRGVSGRRSAAEIEAWAWDPAPRVDLVLAAPIFRLRDEPLGE